jgi:hypothetical protein
VFPKPKTQAAIYPSPTENVAAIPIDPRHTGPRRDVARLTRVEVVTEVAWLEILARLALSSHTKSYKKLALTRLPQGDSVFQVRLSLRSPLSRREV